MLIVHHTDADGHCAAAIIKNEIYTRGPLRFFSYNYTQDIVVEIIPNDIVYLYRLAQDAPLLYAELALKADGLQRYVDAMNEFN